MSWRHGGMHLKDSDGGDHYLNLSYGKTAWERYVDIRKTIRDRNKPREVQNAEVMHLLMDAWERLENGQEEVVPNA